MKFDLKKLLPHGVALVLFILITVFYFAPVILGSKQIGQSDVINFKGMSKEIVDYRNQYHEEPLWTNRMFGGMPAFQISTLYPNNYIPSVAKIFTFGLPHPTYAIALAMLCFYFLLLVLRVDPWIAIFGGLTYGLSSFIYIVIDAGHNPQAVAIAYMPAVFAGFVILLRNKNFLIGTAVTALALSLELNANHLQMTYYLFIILVFYVLAEFVMAIKEKKLVDFFKASAIILVVSGLSIGANLGNLRCTADYGKYTTRGTSDLTMDEFGHSNKEDKTSGLDRSYATAWCYRIDESFTLLIPNYKGGSSSEGVGNHPDAVNAIQDDQFKEQIANSPAYFGDQQFTSGPVYLGSIVVFLFVLALFFVEGPLKWGLLGATILSLMLSWGYHLNGFTNFFLDHVPGYNKFRSVSFTLVMAGLTVPLLGALVVNELMKSPDIFKSNFWITKIDKLKMFYVAFALTGGFCFIVYISPGAFNEYFNAKELDAFTEALKDPKQQEGVQLYMESIEAARKSIVKEDALRSFLFITLAGAGLFLYSRKIISKYIVVGSLAVLVTIDMVMVDRRYLGKESFVKKVKENANPFEDRGRPGVADEKILEDKSLDYRVFNLTTRPDQDAATSYFHNSLGGYHGAKLKRYQELIDFHIGKTFQDFNSELHRNPTDSSINVFMAHQGVVNMMNTKYFIYNPAAPPIPNPYALGNAWFVSDYKMVLNADSEILTLGKINTATTAVIDQKFKEFVPSALKRDPSSTITLTSYKPNDLIYQSKSNADQLAVFSEIYYPSGWNAYVDGKESKYFGANYVLRAMMVPAGEHKIEFKFEPSYYYGSEKISLICSLLVILGSLGIFGYSLKRASENKNVEAA